MKPSTRRPVAIAAASTTFVAAIGLAGFAAASSLTNPAVATNVKLDGTPRAAAAYSSDNTVTWDDTVYFGNRGTKVFAVSAGGKQAVSPPSGSFGADIRDVAVGNGLQRVYFANNDASNSLLSYNLQLGGLQTTRLGTYGAWSVATDATDDTVYVIEAANFARTNGVLHILKGTDTDDSSTVSLGSGSAWDVAVDSDDDTIYVAYGTSGLLVISGSLDDSFVVPIDTTTLGTSAQRIVVHPTDDTIYLYGQGSSGSGRNSVFVSGPAFGDDSAQYSTGLSGGIGASGGEGLALSPDGSALAASSYDTAQLAVFDTASMSSPPVIISSYQSGLSCQPGSDDATLPVVGLSNGWVVGSGTGGTGTNEGCATLITSTPGLTSISPAQGTPAGGTAVTITGSGFTQGLTAVTFDDTPATSVVVIDDTTITAVTPAAAAGLADVKVTTGALDDSLVGGFNFTTTTAPSAPQNPVATGGNASATVTWTAPASDGGSALTGYTVTASPGGQTCTDDTVAPLSCVVTGLTNGTSYTFDVTATNGVGTSSAATSNAVTPSDPTPPPVYPPSQPLNVVGLAGDASAVITWSPPASSGSFAVTDYQVVASPGGKTCVAPAPTATCTLAGLTNGESYTVIVRALNGAGWGPWSAPSASFTPFVPESESIVITGSRAEVKGRTGVRVFGETTGLEGARLQARVHLAGEIEYYDGSQRTVGADGSFTWQRVTKKKVYVYFRTLDDQVRSNRIVITIR